VDALGVGGVGAGVEADGANAPRRPSRKSLIGLLLLAVALAAPSLGCGEDAVEPAQKSNNWDEMNWDDGSWSALPPKNRSARIA
jgi:hypothetical protein